MILLRDAGSASASGGASSGSGAQPSSHQSQPPQSEEAMAEQLRQQVLSDPNMMAQLTSSNPQLADAARADPQRFAQLMTDIRNQVTQAEAERQRAEAELAAADEFDVDAQRRIEEAIQRENVMQNLEHAMEYSPESFGRVHMLYVNTEVNGTQVKAFVDSGAQTTISEWEKRLSQCSPMRANLRSAPFPSVSPECAERCGIMRLLDTRFAGIARGVGTAKILGRVHSAQIKLSSTLFLPCSFTIMEGKGVECLFGLDMLKRYQASIDLRENALIINGERCRFLDEHELPNSAKDFEEPEDEGSAGGAPSSGAPSGQTLSADPRATAGSGTSRSHFPGSGQSLAGSASATSQTSTAPPAPRAAAPSSAAPSNPPQQQQQPSRGGRVFPAESIKALTDLGATEVQARSLLEAAGGNVEVAAGLLFQGN